MNGIIRSVAKRPGEFVKAGEKIFEIQSTEKVRLEGQLDVQYARPRASADMVVTVEPAVPSSPVKSRTRATGRRSPASRSTGHAGRPLIVSAGLDGFALVWDPNLDTSEGPRRHPAQPAAPGPGPRSSPARPPGAKAMLAITGADDGKVRIWDLTNPRQAADRARSTSRPTSTPRP